MPSLIMGTARPVNGSHAARQVTEGQPVVNRPNEGTAADPAENPQPAKTDRQAPAHSKGVSRLHP
jgi:hypothetical protein